jgi:hypothetical protein
VGGSRLLTNVHIRTLEGYEIASLTFLGFESVPSGCQGVAVPKRIESEFRLSRHRTSAETNDRECVTDILGRPPLLHRYSLLFPEDFLALVQPNFN